MTKKLDLRKTIYELTAEYPELVEILKEMGFAGVAYPAVLKTLGKKTTLPEGSRMQGKDLQDVISHLEEHGFKVVEGDS